MKITAIFLFAGFLHLSANGFAQEKISLSEKNATLQKVFKDIQNHSNYIVWYEDSVLQGTSKVNFEVKDVTVEELLDLCCKNQGLEFSIIEKNIAIAEKKGKRDNNSRYRIDIKGKVLSEKGESLAGAAILVKGTNEGTQTDAAGIFELKNIDPSAELIISFTGYQTQTIHVKGNTSLVITLSISTNPLDEVQVIAYGTVSKRLNTGNVSTIKAETIEEQPVSNPLAALEGRVPGLLITQQTGVPGGNFTVQIRGQNSIANGNDPFYIIDGVPFISVSLTQIGVANGSSNPLNSINPSDIESIEVLKDADATAIYGSRGANGVILITTKKGQFGKDKIDINLYDGMGRATRFAKYLNTSQYLEMRSEAIRNDSDSLTDPNIFAPDLLQWDTTRYTDWQKLLIGGTAHYTDATASVSGGNANTQFVFGAGYHRETTVFPGDFADQKGSAHFNLNHTSINQKFRSTISVSYTVDNNDLLETDLSGMTNLPPDAPPVYDSSGKLNWANGTFEQNPFAQLLWKSKANTYNLIANSVLSYLILPGLQLKTSLGYNKIEMTEILTIPLSSFDPARNIPSGNSRFGNNTINSWIIEPQLNYGKKIAGGRLDILLGSTFQQNTQNSLLQYGYNFSSDALLTNIAAAATVYDVSNSVEYRYNAIFGRFNYNWNSKYLFDFTARRDGSSRFGPGKQFANFGAAGAAWIFSKENFIEHYIPFISFGKIRASYGITGNDQIGDYMYLSTYSPNYYVYQGSVGLIPTSLYNKDFAWEINKKLEGGVELGILKNRILFNASFYRNRSGNQLVGYPLPLITGFNSIEMNRSALVQNTGIEVELSAIEFKTKDLTWTSSFNLTIPKNELVSFPGIENTSYSSSLSVGQPLNIYKGAHYLGVDPQTGIYQFADENGKPINYSSLSYPNDYQYTKKIGTKYYGGLQNSLSYKGWKLDIFFQFMNQIGNAYLYNGLPGTYGNQPVTVLSRWQMPGDISSIQRFNQDYSLSYGQSDQILKDASFIRLKNISISYSLPSKLMQNAGIQSIRIYLQAQNLFTITKYIGLDPENQSNSLPPLQVITIGIQLTI